MSASKTFYDNAAVHYVMTVNLTRQLFQDVHMHMLFDLLAIIGCYKLHNVYSTMLNGLDFAKSEMTESTLQQQALCSRKHSSRMCQ